MKKFYVLSLIIACVVIACTSFTSCGIDTSEDPEFPLYVTYSISVNCEGFDGPDQLLTEINKWVDNNKFVYDVQVSYNTGAPEEFADTDQKAVEEKYNVFLPKFKTFLEETKANIAKGTYGDVKEVKARFIVYCSRLQGQGKDIASEVVDFVYPTPSSAK